MLMNVFMRLSAGCGSYAICSCRVFIIASLILWESKSSGSEIAILMSLLLFDEIASIEIW